MGSPLSPIIANLFMEDLEVRAMQLAILRPSLWLRYVDDTFVIWPHGEEELQFCFSVEYITWFAQVFVNSAIMM